MFHVKMQERDCKHVLSPLEIGEMRANVSQTPSDYFVVQENSYKSAPVSMEVE